MPERLDKLTIALDRGEENLSWDARQALLSRLQHVHESSNLRAMFDAVGATRRVELSPAQKATLLGLLDQWSLADTSEEPIPTEFNNLRDALRKDLADHA